MSRCGCRGYDAVKPWSRMGGLDRSIDVSIMLRGKDSHEQKNPFPLVLDGIGRRADWLRCGDDRRRGRLPRAGQTSRSRRSPSSPSAIRLCSRSATTLPTARPRASTMSRGKPVQEGVRVQAAQGHDLGEARRHVAGGDQEQEPLAGWLFPVAASASRSGRHDLPQIRSSTKPRSRPIAT